MNHYKLPMTDRQMALRFQMRLNDLHHLAVVTPDNTLYIESKKEVRAKGLVPLTKEAFEDELWQHSKGSEG